METQKCEYHVRYILVYLCKGMCMYLLNELGSWIT
jgi:hypothetical protein